MLTVDDLARDLKVRNEDLLRELVTMGYKVDGPESPLETEDPAALRAELVTILPKREVIEKRIKPTVIRRRMKRPPEVEAKEQAILSPVPEPVVERLVEKAPKPLRQEKTEPPLKQPARKPLEKPKRRDAARIIEKAPVAAVEPAPLARIEVEKPKPEQQPVEAKEVRAEVIARTGAAEPAVKGLEKIEAPKEEPGVIGLEEEVVEEKPSKKRKKKEKKIQPAQIIGRVDLKKEPVREPEPPQPAPIPRSEVERIERPVLIVAQPPAEGLFSEEERRKRKKKDRRAQDLIEERLEEDKSGVRRRKEVLLRGDLYDEGLRHGRLKARGKKTVQRKTEITVPKAIKRRLKLPDLVTVADLAHKMSVKASEVVRHLLALGVSATMNEGVDFDTASILASEFGFEAESSEHSEAALLPAKVADAQEALQPRPPVVTVMGHVDHGKTSLLDFIRSTHVTAQESGGITQHIGAYKVRLGKGEIVFLDTPGHEAFTAMRARGAQVTDFVVLVVAADDGVKEQTREAINHARAAKVPIVVAINKIDKPEADRDRVTRELSEYDLIPEAWGGDTLVTYVSARTGEGIPEFLEMILLHAELMELKANPNKTASGTIIEARLDKGKGPVATVLVREGTLELGDAFVAGTSHGKVRAMLDHEGLALQSAGPATPVEVQGFSGVPEASEPFIVVEDERIARQIADFRYQKQKQKEAAAPGPISLEDLLARIQGQEARELNLIIKADVQGSVEALKEALIGLSTNEVHVKVIHEGVGTVTESDVMLASASRAMTIGFNVRPAPKTLQLAEEQKVEVRLYTVIYETIEDIRKATERMLAPITKETVGGRAEVRMIFNISKVGTVAGCHVISGKIQRSANVRLLRDDVPVYDGKMASMRRFKDDVKECAEGYECGIALENFKDIKVGDVIESYTIEQEPAKLA
jgi:translation initiation factor IF-2